MRLQSVPARQGGTWVRRGFRAFFRQPLAFAALFATVSFTFIVLVWFVPLIGPILMFALLPLITLGFMIATRQTVEGGYPTPAVFAAPLRGERPRRMAMLRLCIGYAVATLLVVLLADTLDGGSVTDLMQNAQGGGLDSEAAAAKAASDPRIEFGLMLRFALTGLLSLIFWHAPALVHWEGQGAAQAVFTSTLACWRNKGAFLVYGLYWFSVAMMVALGASLLAALFGTASMLPLLLAPVSLLLSTAFYASLYFTYADTFVDDAPAPSLERNPTP